MLSLYCIFNGLFASSADSGLFYFLQVPLTVVLFYAIRSADREREAIKLMNVVRAAHPPGLRPHGPPSASSLTGAGLPRPWPPETRPQYIGGTMLLALVSSLYFVVLSNHIQIAYRECSRIGGPFPALYSGTGLPRAASSHQRHRAERSSGRGCVCVCVCVCVCERASIL